jgi:fucose permease
MTENKSKFRWGLVIFTFICMTVFGMYENMTGPAMPSIVSQFDTTYTAIGTLLVLSTLGYLIGTITGGFATDKFGFKPVFVVSFLLVIISAVLLRYAQSFFALVALFVLMRIGFGGFETGCNSLGAKIFIRSSAVMMNIMHLFFGLGSITGSQLIVRILSSGRQWYSAYLSGTLVAIAGLAMGLFIVFPSSEDGDEHADFKSLKNLPIILKDKILWIIMLALGFAELMELGTVVWLVNFLETAKGVSPIDAGFYLTAFFVFFSVARMLGGWIAEKIGYLKFVIICGFASSLLFFVAYIFGGELTIFYSIAGAPIAMMFPMVMAVIMKHYKKNIGTIMGIIIALAGLMYMGLSQIIGFVADKFSVQASFALVGVAGFIACIFVIMARRKIGSEVSH